MGSETRRNFDFLTLQANCDSGPHPPFRGVAESEGATGETFHIGKEKQGPAAMAAAA